MPDTPQDPAAITEWHAHVYYDPASRDRAAALREWVEARFPPGSGLRMGRWHDVPVGPSAGDDLSPSRRRCSRAAPFLALNRLGLTLLLHPESGRPRDDHTLHALWMGAVLAVKTEVLAEVG